MLDKKLPTLAVQSRPSLSRYDRPALSLSELMNAEGSDFVHFASWTIVGQRVTVEELQRLANVLESHGKLSVLTELHKISKSGRDVPQIEGLSKLILLERRKKVPIVGDFLAKFTLLQEANFGIPFSSFSERNLPRWIGWTGRRIKRVIVRVGSEIRLPTLTRFRNSLGVRHAAPDRRLSPEAIVIYHQLCSAIDSVEGR